MAELERAFFLDDLDKELLARRRGDHNRLGFALQLTTVRWLGTFLPDPLDVPGDVVTYLAGQLDIAGPACLGRYTERRTTRFEHVEEIKAAYELQDFAEVEKELEAWVDARAWTGGDGPKAIFNDALAWLAKRHVLLPGVTTLARTVARVRDQATERLYETLYYLLSDTQHRMLESAGRMEECFWPHHRRGVRVVVGSGVLGPGLTCESADAVSSCPTNDPSAGAQELSRRPPVLPV